MVQPKTRWVAAATHHGRYAGLVIQLPGSPSTSERLEPREDPVEHDRPDQQGDDARHDQPLDDPAVGRESGQGHVDRDAQEHPGPQVEAASERQDHAVVDGIGGLPVGWVSSSAFSPRGKVR